MRTLCRALCFEAFVLAGLKSRRFLTRAGVGDSDRAQLEYAWQTKRVLYTFNVNDFCRLHKEYLTEGKPHAGIVVVYRQRYSVGEQLRLLLKLADLKSAEDLRNGLVFL